MHVVLDMDDRFYPAPYVGDLEDLRTVKALAGDDHATDCFAGSRARGL